MPHKSRYLSLFVVFLFLNPRQGFISGSSVTSFPATPRKTKQRPAERKGALPQKSRCRTRQYKFFEVLFVVFPPGNPRPAESFAVLTSFCPTPPPHVPSNFLRRRELYFSRHDQCHYIFRGTAESARQQIEYHVGLTQRTAAAAAATP